MKSGCCCKQLYPTHGGKSRRQSSEGRSTGNRSYISEWIPLQPIERRNNRSSGRLGADWGWSRTLHSTPLTRESLPPSPNRLLLSGFFGFWMITLCLLFWRKVEGKADGDNKIKDEQSTRGTAGLGHNINTVIM